MSSQFVCKRPWESASGTEDREKVTVEEDNEQSITEDAETASSSMEGQERDSLTLASQSARAGLGDLFLWSTLQHAGKLILAFLVL
jgi:hypothetical protein